MKSGKWRTVRKVIAYILLFCLIVWFLSGSINQVKTGQSIANWSIEKGTEVGQWLYELFTGKGPLEMTDDGIYLKDGAISGDDKNSSNNEESNKEDTSKSNEEKEE